MQVVKKLLKKKFRGPTKVVLTESLPEVLQHDGIQKPDELCFEVDMYPSEMLQKAQRLINKADTKVHATYISSDRPNRVNQVFFLNTSGTQEVKLTKKLRKQYMGCLNGSEPEMEIKELIPQEGTRSEKRLKYTMAVCASIHLVFVLPPETTDQACLPCELNPFGLLCTCKGFRGCSLCPHVIAATALFIPNTYTSDYIEELLQIIQSKRGKKRPRKAVDGTRIQPDSSDDEESDEEDSSEEEGGIADDDAF